MIYLIQIPNRSYLQKEIDYLMEKEGFTSYDEPTVFSIESYSITYKLKFYKGE